MDYSNYSKEELIKLLNQKDEKIDALEVKIYEVQKEKNEVLKKLEEVLEKKLVESARRFAKKSEIKTNVFNEAETYHKEKSHPGRKEGSTNFDYEYLEAHVDNVITLEPEESVCKECGDILVDAGSDVTYKVSYKAAKLVVTKIISKKKVCPKGHMIVSPIKDDPFPHSICTPSLAAQIMVDKFLLGVPYYRQSQYYYDEGIKLSRQDLCNYQMRATEILEKYYERLKYHLLNTKCKVICADETTLKVVKEKKTCYMWVYLTSFYDQPIYIYDYAIDRKADNPIKFLNGYHGYLLTDAYQAYDKVLGVTNCYCWVHARRNFMDIIKGLGEKQLKSSKAKKMVDMIDELFDLEREYRKKKLTPKQIKLERNKLEFISKIDKIKHYLDNIDASPTSTLGKARDYMLKRWDGFLSFLKDGHVEMSNNISERAVKPFVIARKNFLFSFTSNGARSSAIYFSIQQTSRANGFDPKDFVITLLEKLRWNSTDEELDKLMPWNMKKARTNE